MILVNKSHATRILGLLAVVGLLTFGSLTAVPQTTPKPTSKKMQVVGDYGERLAYEILRHGRRYKSLRDLGTMKLIEKISAVCAMVLTTTIASAQEVEHMTANGSQPSRGREAVWK